MHNLKNLRKHIDTYKKKFKDRNIDFDTLDFNEKDKLNRDLINKKEKLEQEKKILSKSKDESNFLRSKKMSYAIFLGYHQIFLTTHFIKRFNKYLTNKM